MSSPAARPATEGPPDELFAQHLLKSGMATTDQIQAALRLQSANVLSGDPISMAQALERQGVITAQQRMAVEKKLVSSRGVSRLGPYKLKRKVGEGGMGVVYLARDTRDRKLFALKLLTRAQAREVEAVRRFRREVEAAMQLDHPNIARAHDVGQDKGYHYYVMEFCDGEPLGRRLKREKFLPLEEAVDLTAQVARALRYAHSKGFVHRDIKPENIILTPQGVAKVLDLGLSKKILDGESSHLTMSGVAMGTPHYISPEQAKGDREIDARADIYSLGATFYHFVTGDTPFHGTSSFEVINQHVNAKLPDPRDRREGIPEDVVHIIRRMMAKRKQDRYRNCEELLAELERLIRGEAPTTGALDANLSTIAEPVRIPPKPAPRRPLALARRMALRRKPLAAEWIVLAVAVAFVLALLLVALSRS